jgi:hypothetical protein
VIAPGYMAAKKVPVVHAATGEIAELLRATAIDYLSPVKRTVISRVVPGRVLLTGYSALPARATCSGLFRLSLT